MDDTVIFAQAKQCLALESQAICATADQLDSRFSKVVHLVAEAIAQGQKLIFSGVGKNAPIAQKLSATFNSTGVPACFLDAAQALHGDVGLCRCGDLLFLLSNSGETRELIELIPTAKRLGVELIAFTSATQSQLTELCAHHLIYQVPQEACPLDLAPTASTTACLALGDALAMVLIELRGFTQEDFARYHPGGNLGKQLLLRIQEIMRQGSQFASAPQNVSIQEAILCITSAKCGTVALYHPETKELTGVFSDGDFRRCALEHPDILSQPVSNFMTRHPISIVQTALAVDALQMLEKHKINDLIVVDETQHPVGVVDGQDLPRLKIL